MAAGAVVAMAAEAAEAQAVWLVAVREACEGARMAAAMAEQVAVEREAVVATVRVHAAMAEVVMAMVVVVMVMAAAVAMMMVMV